MLNEGSLWEMTGLAGVTTFIGAGGKTTSLHRLAGEITACGYPAVLTTTTKVFPSEDSVPWQNTDTPPPVAATPYFWYAGIERETGKWLGPAREAVEAAIARESIPKNQSYAESMPVEATVQNPSTRFWVIEGDGARGHRLKCWAEHEPQIPANTECAVLVLDAGLWGTMLKEEDVHRSELCPGFPGQLFSTGTFWAYLKNSPVFYERYSQLTWVAMFNYKTGWDNSPLLGNAQGFLNEIYLSYRKKEQELKAHNPLPKHLRIAGGDVKASPISWIDLW